MLFFLSFLMLTSFSVTEPVYTRLGKGRCEQEVSTMALPSGFSQDGTFSPPGNMYYNSRTTLESCAQLCQSESECSFFSWKEDREQSDGTAWCYISAECNLVDADTNGYDNDSELYASYSMGDVAQDQTSLTALSQNVARCPRPDGTNWVTTVAWGLEQCTDAVKRYTGTATWTVEQVSSQHLPCGCFFDQGSSKIRWNEFQHPCWCWGECGYYGEGKENMGDNAMANQDSVAAGDNYQALCKTYPTESTVTNSVFDSDVNGASFSLSISEARCSHDNTIGNLEQCKASAAALGVTFGEVQEFNSWAEPCGCHYNPTQNTLRFNAFVHPYYCWSNEEVGCEKCVQGTYDLGPRGTVTGNYLHQDKNAINSFPICYEKIHQPMFDYIEPIGDLEVVEEPNDETQGAPEAMSLLKEAESFYGDVTLYGLAAVGLSVVLYQAGNFLSTGHKYNEVVEEVEC